MRFGAHRVAGRSSRRFRARMRIRNPSSLEPRTANALHGRGSGSTTVAAARSSATGSTPASATSASTGSAGSSSTTARSTFAERAFTRTIRRSGRRSAPSSYRTNIGFLKQLGATITRSHYPFHPYFLELADRNGIMVWSEIPVFRMASRLFAISEVRLKALRMLRREIDRDFNHPSVMVWSVGNENASRPGTGLRKYIRKAARTVEDLDPTRLVGIATSGFPTVQKQQIYTELDVLGDQRLLRLVQRPARDDLGSDPAGRLSQPAALRLSEPGARHNRVRRRGQPPRSRNGEGHLRVPVRVPQVPPGRVRGEAVRQRRPDLEPARLPREAGLDRRQSVPEPAHQPEGPRRRRRPHQAGVLGRHRRSTGGRAPSDSVPSRCDGSY